MTTKTLSLFYRFVHHSLILFLGGISVAGIAKVLYLFLQQTFVAGNMRAVTGKALSFSSRWMLHPLLKNVAVVTLKTNDGRHGYPLAHQEYTQQPGQDHYRS